MESFTEETLHKIKDRDISFIHEMQNLLQAFRLSDIQTAYTIHLWLERNNRSIKEDLKEYMENRLPSHTSSIIVDPNSVQFVDEQAVINCSSKKVGGYIKCHKCGHKRAKTYEVNTKPCNQVGGTYKYQILCAYCEHEEYV